MPITTTEHKRHRQTKSRNHYQYRKGHLHLETRGMRFYPNRVLYSKATEAILITEKTSGYWLYTHVRTKERLTDLTYVHPKLRTKRSWLCTGALLDM